MKQIILWVLSKIYYTICNRKAQVFLRIMYIIPHNIRTQKRAAAERMPEETVAIVLHSLLLILHCALYFSFC
ncbi:MAG TPA: hypothetical protein DHV92_05095 [Ruminococcaceae bacterium]|nr:hypothetical protein [Oscillospiraceae bacterium]